VVGRVALAFEEDFLPAIVTLLAAPADAIGRYRLYRSFVG